jgi:hypothetical protein
MDEGLLCRKLAPERLSQLPQIDRLPRRENKAGQGNAHYLAHVSRRGQRSACYSESEGRHGPKDRT